MIYFISKFQIFLSDTHILPKSIQLSQKIRFRSKLGFFFSILMMLQSHFITVPGSFPACRHCFSWGCQDTHMFVFYFSSGLLQFITCWSTCHFLFQLLTAGAKFGCLIAYEISNYITAIMKWFHLPPVKWQIAFKSLLLTNKYTQQATYCSHHYKMTIPLILTVFWIMGISSILFCCCCSIYL